MKGKQEMSESSGKCHYEEMKERFFMGIGRRTVEVEREREKLYRVSVVSVA